MSNLQNTNYGRSILQYALESLTGRRIGKRLRRQYYLAMLANTGLYDGDSSLSKLVGDMNTAHDQELIDCYEYAGRFGGTKESISDQEYYVDPVGGSDSEGNGTAASPFQTLSFLSYCLPAKINHAYRIVITGDMTIDAINIDAEFGPSGTLSIIGAAVETVDLAAQTSTGVITNHAILSTVVAAAAWGADQFAGSWQHWIDAPASNQCQAIFYNSSDDIYTSNQYPAAAYPVVGDQFNVISPSITLVVNSISLSARNAFSGEENALRGAKIGFYNLNLDMRLCDQRYAITATGQISFSFVKLIVDDDTPPVNLENSEFNLLGSSDHAQISNLALCNVANLAHTTTPNEDTNIAGLSILNTDGQTHTHDVMNIKSSSAKSITVRARITCSGDSFLKGIIAGLFLHRYGTILSERCGVSTADDSGCVTSDMAHSKLNYWTIVGIFGVGTVNDSFYHSFGGINDAILDEIDSTAISLSWLILVSTMLHAAQSSISPTSAVADIQFNTLVVPTTFALPAAGVGVTDAIGAWVTGLT